MTALLLHPRLTVRYLTLLALLLAIFLLAWWAAFQWLPEGLLRGRTAGAALAGMEAAGSFASEWLRLVAINLALGALLVVGGNILRNGPLPMGLFVVLIWGAVYAVTLGTNSFSLPLPGGPLAPGLAVLARSGPYELAAFALAAAATARRSRYALQGRWPRQKVVAANPQPLTPYERLALGLAVLLLLTANAWEAFQIIQRAA